jgi:RNA polymerase sigma factor (sigma-70 family)
MESFEQWYEREHPKVLSACAALTGDVFEAGEATDEAFARALERWPSVAAMASPGGWVQVVALNRLRRNLRRRGRERHMFTKTLRDTDPVSVSVPDPELWAEVAGLPNRQRAAMVLRYVHDLPEATIAELMGISRGTVASTLAAARASLQRRLAQPIGEDAALPNQEKTR